jgi:tetratricopeptide (TPR) repeat protein
VIKPLSMNIRIAKILLIVLLTSMAYLPAIQGGFIWDDDDYVTENPTLRSMDGLADIWISPQATPQYYPLVHTSFWIEYQLWGLHPMGYHIINVLLHIGAALLLWRLLLLLGLPHAWLAAAIFALHPVHVESVAWITERKNVLSLVFYLISAIIMVRWLGLVSDDRSLKHPRAWYIGGIAWFTAALLSKTVTCSLPAALLLIIWWRRGRIARQEIFALAPFFVLGLISGLSTAWLEQHHVGALGAEWSYGWIERILIAGRVIWFYGAKMIWPLELMFNYPRWSVDSGIWWQYLYPIGFVLILAILWAIGRRLGRGPLTAALFFSGTLFPALGFIDVYPFRYAFVADHFQYHASLGLIVALAAALGIAGSRLPRRAALALAGLLLLVLAGRTYIQCYDYTDIESLWRRTIAKNPYSWLAHNNLGVMLHTRGQDRAALDHYHAAVRAQPAYTEALNNMGSVYAGLGESEKALACFKKALAVEPENVLAHYNLGVEYADRGEIDNATRYYRRTLQLDANYSRAHNNLGLLLANRGEWDAAVAHYRKAVAINPELAEAHYNWGVAMIQQHQPDAAVPHLKDALAIDPRSVDASHQLGVAYGRQGDFEAAIQQYRHVLAFHPEHVQARVNYGVALTRTGDRRAAIREFKHAVGLAPARAEIHYNLGSALSAGGQSTEALRHFRIALELNPKYYLACLNMGITLAQSGDLPAARDHFQKAVDMQPKSPLAYRYLSQAQWLAGQRKSARKTYQKLAAIDPGQASMLNQMIPEITASE